MPLIKCQRSAWNTWRLQRPGESLRRQTRDTEISSVKPAVQARTANTAVSVLVRGMIFRVRGYKGPRLDSGTRAIIRKLANWLAQSSAVKPKAIHVVRHGSPKVQSQVKHVQAPGKGPPSDDRREEPLIGDGREIK